uniref:Peptidase M12A domain-containing protein n=1 Tax=Ditylenchus dipsaci TaxID=166011 RepID=A0A915DP41_9BILA
MILGDVLLTNEQIDELETESEQRRQKRQLQKENPYNKWDPKTPISYTFDDSLGKFFYHSKKEKEEYQMIITNKYLIRLSLDFWSKFTCITFLENGYAKPVVRFFKGQGCNSQ